MMGQLDFSNLFERLSMADPWMIGLGILFVLLLCGFGLPLPEDIVLIFTGYVCYLEVLPFWLGLLIGLGGVLAGDSVLWWIGHRFGRHVLELRLFRSFLSPPRLAKIERLYQRYGNRMLIGARFSPGIRSGVFLFAGLSGVKYRRFVLTDGSAALLSVPVLVTLSYLFGDRIEWVIKSMRGVQHWIVIAILVVVAVHLLQAWFSRRKERRVLQAGGGAAVAGQVSVAAPRDGRSGLDVRPGAAAVGDVQGVVGGHAKLAPVKSLVGVQEPGRRA